MKSLFTQIVVSRSCTSYSARLCYPSKEIIMYNRRKSKACDYMMGYKRGFVDCIPCIAAEEIMRLWAGQKISNIYEIVYNHCLRLGFAKKHFSSVAGHRTIP